MLALVIALGVAVVLLGVLVAGLLRSHAEILRALHELGVDAYPDSAPATGAPAAAPGATADAPAARQLPDGTVLEPGPDGQPFRTRADVAPPRDAFPTAADVVGVTPSGEAVGIGVTGVGSDTVLAFLSSGCTTCATFWDAFAHPQHLRLPRGARLVVVTKGPDDESVSRLREIAPDGVTVVMSTDAWLAYEVPVSPYVVFVDGTTGRVRGEGAATTWDAVADLLATAVSDADAQAAGGHTHADRQERASRLARADHERERRVDADLARAGIAPGHTSLHPRTEQDLVVDPHSLPGGAPHDGPAVRGTSR